MGEASKVSGVTEELLIFELGERLYALPSSQVREVLRAFSAVPIPIAPAIVEGLLNVRGDIIPLLSLRRRLGIAERPLSLTDHFIIAKEGSRLLALRVDRVVNLQRASFQRPFDPGRYASGSEVISGVATIPDGMVLIHDLGRFLSAEQREPLDRAVREAAGAVREEKEST